ncbi:FHA domain-containing protein, partial [bacterium]|nr:FHA domain-containing protein [bacterium]
MPYLEVQLTKKLHRVYDLGERTIIGRSPGCAIQLLSRAVSRRHAGIEVAESGVVLSDLGAPNGVKVNGAKIQATYNLTEGDRII